AEKAPGAAGGGGAEADAWLGIPDLGDASTTTQERKATSAASLRMFTAVDCLPAGFHLKGFKLRLSSLYVCFQPVWHTGASVVRSAVILLRHWPLGKDCSLRLGRKALVHHAAWTAYHKDHLARDPPGETHAYLVDACRLGRSPSFHSGGLPCLPSRPSTESVSGLTPHDTVIVSPFSDPIASLPQSPSP